MPIVDDKKAVFGNIAALKTLNEGYPSFNLSNSFPSVNNGKDGVAFLVDLLKALVGFEELRDMVVDALTFDMGSIEEQIKKVLKFELKKLVSCGVDPSIPDFLKHQLINPPAPGVDVVLNKVDFTGLMFIDPQGEFGGLYYDDETSGIASTDFNTFLYETVQNDGSQENWGTQTGLNPILSFEFNSTGPVNNTLNIRASAFYSDPSNSKTLTDLNNDYIDSVQLFSTDKLINNIVDTLFGSISVEIKKTTKQLEQEAAVENIVECILNTDDTDVVDNSFFEFSNEEVRVHQEIANDRRRGIKKIASCRNIETSVPADELIQFSNDFKATVNKVEEKQVVSNAINSIGDQASSNAPTADKYNIKLNFIENLIKKLTLAIVNAILSPKVIMIFALNHKIINGLASTTDGPIDFMKQNKALIQGILKGVRDAIIQLLLKKALSAIKKLVAENATALITEKVNFQKAQLLSLVGIPQEVLRIIANLN